MAQPSPFTPALFEFFRDLGENNRKEWFDANRGRYEADVLEPSTLFVLAFRSHLHAISPHFVAEPRVQGGSLFRIHTNRRFNPDRPPYKDHAGVQFAHRAKNDVHAPGFYLHLQPSGGTAMNGGDSGCFAGMGVWRPEREALASIRQSMVEDPEGWKRATRRPTFTERLRLGGDSLKRGPAGFDRDHELIEDLKRKDVVAYAELSEDDVVADGFVERFAEDCRAGAPFVAWLCNAVGAPF